MAQIQWDIQYCILNRDLQNRHRIDPEYADTPYSTVQYGCRFFLSCSHVDCGPVQY
jgi:hypothetical protein